MCLAQTTSDGNTTDIPQFHEADPIRAEAVMHFNELSFSVTDGRKEKRLIDKVSLTARSGQLMGERSMADRVVCMPAQLTLLTAIMGPSGSGEIWHLHRRSVGD
jgi:hypothetical protein